MRHGNQKVFALVDESRVVAFFRRSDDGSFSAYEGDQVPEVVHESAPDSTLAVWEGDIYDLTRMTEDEIDEINADRSFDTWWIGQWRVATIEEAAKLLNLVPPANAREETHGL